MTLDLGLVRVSRQPLLDARAVPWSFDEPRSRPGTMFPTVLDMSTGSDAMPRPLDRFYMYYAPHLSEGIGLATAPSVDGPWTPNAGNPVVSLRDVPALRDHVSSPEVVFRPDHADATLWMYFHGVTEPGDGRQNTCLATSPDGVRWSFNTREPVLTGTPQETGEGGTTAYLRLFRRADDDRWYGLYKSNKTHGLARSTDGLSWEHYPDNPLIRPDAKENEYDLIRHTGLVVHDDMLYIFYSTFTQPDLGREEIKLATLPLHAQDWRDWGPLRRHGIVFAPEASWEAGDVRDPFVLIQNDTVCLFYAGGREQGIGLATTRLGALARVPRE